MFIYIKPPSPASRQMWRHLLRGNVYDPQSDVTHPWCCFQGHLVLSFTVVGHIHTTATLATYTEWHKKLHAFLNYTNSRTKSIDVEIDVVHKIFFTCFIQNRMLLCNTQSTINNASSKIFYNIYFYMQYAWNRNRRPLHAPFNVQVWKHLAHIIRLTYCWLTADRSLTCYSDIRRISRV